ncbi:MAG: methyltransferase [Pseudomonadota bacterium]
MDRNILRLSLAGLAATLALACATTMAAEPAAPAAPAKPYVIPAGTADFIVKAVQSKDRPAADVARDFDRKPAELLTLSGVKPGDHILEFASFGQYFTNLLSPIVGDKGSVYMLDLPYTEARSGAASKAFVATHPNSQYHIEDYNAAVLPQNLDEVFIVLYYHDLGLQNIDTAALNAKVFKSLKPGGVFFVVDHNARPGSGRDDTKALHRIDPAVVKQEITAAGFELVTESKLLANPADDHTWMVFTKDKRGTTDQTVWKFRKPLKAK